MRTVGLHEILRADPDAIARLAASDLPAWQRLEAHAARGGDCPAALLRALLDLDDLPGWLTRITLAYRELPPHEGGGGNAATVFQPWLVDAVVLALPIDDLRSLDAHLFALLRYTRSDAAARARLLVHACERTGSPHHRALLARALVVLALRSGEDGDHDAAIAATVRAEEVCRAADLAEGRAQAIRARAAILLRQHRLDDALALVDTVLDLPGTIRGDFVHRWPRPEIHDPVDACFREAALAALGATRTSASWSASLRALAAQLGHQGCAERAEAGERALRDLEPDDGTDAWERLARQGRIV